MILKSSRLLNYFYSNCRLGEWGDHLTLQAAADQVSYFFAVIVFTLSLYLYTSSQNLYDIITDFYRHGFIYSFIVVVSRSSSFFLTFLYCRSWIKIGGELKWLEFLKRRLNSMLVMYISRTELAL